MRNPKIKCVIQKTITYHLRNTQSENFQIAKSRKKFQTKNLGNIKTKHKSLPYFQTSLSSLCLNLAKTYSTTQPWITENINQCFKCEATQHKNTTPQHQQILLSCPLIQQEKMAFIYLGSLHKESIGAKRNLCDFVDVVIYFPLCSTHGPNNC